MSKIRVLSDILASQVAAGEVVERPASVVKELVENSLDAGAGEIRVDIDRGGSALIRVGDDGCGMSREDALLSLERHATSKLRTAGDLAEIRTLGFRGEAVPSIASVSRFRLVTREREAVAGTEIVVEGGRIVDVRDAGCAPGTVIEAKALFFNLPARRKFLRAETTEAAHVEHQLRLHALAAPGVRFRFRKDGGEVFDLPGVARSVDRVRQLLGPELAGELIPLPATHGNGVSVEGFLLPAVHARKGRRHQCVFLNGRPVEDGLISRALAEGFRGALADGLHPAAWVWISMEPLLVDVNVHPAKREVRFHRPLDLKQVLLDATLAGLKPAVAVPDRPAVPEVAPLAVERWARAAQERLPLVAVPTEVPDAASPMAERAGEVPEPAEGWGFPAAGGAAAAGAPSFRVMDLLHHRFVLLESEDGLVVFDPRAARERIHYERLLRHGAGGVECQGLLVPVLLELDPRDLDLVLRNRSSLEDAGLEVEGFGGNTLQVRSLPAVLPVEDPREFLGDLMDELLNESAPGGRFTTERLARLLARRAAFGSVPKLGETRRLLEELFACALPYCAPDGRPTLSEFGLRELERRFGHGRG